ncbi:hypothetical protein RCO27_04340 [Sphingosinicella sp. LHD-64]|uniref:hypothetical protein n=1 Tax=Sphingosinicella sp. LHD-64 TaxID=3072139 RepID=UPI00280C86A1|nr:hypothetical protein [Sphingosinicella sp. LHD-64]MDQ8755451.1 hypothetical protein [Sphingosinicella sp. LHD-64]
MDADEVEIGKVLDELYDMISGPAGPRDWSRQRAIFHEDSRQMRTWVDAAGAPAIRIMAREAYAADTTPFFAENDFYEIETARRINIFGNIAHVWSLYEARRSPDADLDRRGINSIQLYKSEDGWKVISMIWDNERPGVVASL